MKQEEDTTSLTINGEDCGILAQCNTESEKFYKIGNEWLFRSFLEIVFYKKEGYKPPLVGECIKVCIKKDGDIVYLCKMEVWSVDSEECSPNIKVQGLILESELK